jgi:hypothetical protein
LARKCKDDSRIYLHFTLADFFIQINLRHNNIASSINTVGRSRRYNFWKGKQYDIEPGHKNGICDSTVRAPNNDSSNFVSSALMTALPSPKSLKRTYNSNPVFCILSDTKQYTIIPPNMKTGTGILYLVLQV